MKIRRITLAILALLTVLFVADMRYFQPRRGRSGQPSVRFQVEPSRVAHFHAEKTQVFTRPQGSLSSLTLSGALGHVELRSTDGTELVVRATILGETEEELARFEVVESVSNGEISYKLGPQTAQFPEVGLSFAVEVPAGMEVTVKHSYGSVEVEDFVGFLRLLTSFSQVTVTGLQGSLSVENQFGSVELLDISGPLAFEDAFSNSTVLLSPVDGGYNFQVDVTNGSLTGNAPLEKEVRQNMIKAQGTHGEGVHPVVIESSFGSVNLNIGR